MTGRQAPIPSRRSRLAGALAGASLLLAVAPVLLVGSAAAATNCTPDGAWGTNRSDLASQVVSLINQHRAGLGLGTLSSSSSLQASSVWKSLHMAGYNYFGHSDPAPPVNRDAAQRARDCDFVGSSWGENIAAGYGTPQAVVTGWLNSPGHRANIENPNYTVTGVGVAASAGGRLYWTQNFGRTSGSSPPPPPPPPPPTAPVNTAWPVLSGIARQGQTLTSTNGTWTGSGITYGYAWRRCDVNGNNCTTIVNANLQSYVLTAADVGSKVYSLVTATNAAGSASQRSALSATVTVAAPANTAWPVLSGIARQGQTLTSTNGTWTGSGITYGYAWRRCDVNGNNCTTIVNANLQSYVLTAADVGSKVYSLVTATNAAGSASQRSALSATVTVAAPANTAWPVLSGIARQGQTLTSTNGTWTGSGITYGYAWRRCDVNGNNCTTIVNANLQSYVLTAADVGSKVYSLVTATNAAGSASQRSALSAIVVAAP